MADLKKIFNAWASGKASRDFTQKQWLLSKWENIDGIDWPQEKIAAMITHIGERLALSGDQTLLDLGCGGGWILKEIQPLTRGAWGLDISLNMLKHAQEFFSEGKWVNGEAQQIPFKDAVFDRLLSYFVFVNILDDGYINRSLEEIRRVLKPGGKALIAQLPDRDKSEAYDQAKREYLDYCAQAFSFGANYRDENYVPLHLFDRGAFCAMAEEVGFRCRAEPSFNPFYRTGQPLTVDWRFDVLLEKGV